MGMAEESGEGGARTQLWRVDAACDAFESDWRSGVRPRIESYVVGSTPHQRKRLLGELVALELELRRVAGERPSLDEYRSRFPELAEVNDSALDPPAESGPPPSGRYRVLHPLARGGLGEVSVAYDGVLRREVALKEILPGQAGDPDRRARFLREARMTGALEHPGIVPVHDSGRRDDGRPFYVMRLLRESSLKDAIAHYHRPEEAGVDPSWRSVAFRDLIRRVVDVCNAIGYAHSRGVIHRDLKPANVMLGPFGETLVVDWGLARFFERPDDAEQGASIDNADDTPEVTRTGAVLGTPRYMSPEQARGDRVLGPACDVYGVGAILYSVLAGRAPFDGKHTATVLQQVRLGAIAPPRQVNPSVSSALSAVCLKAMALRLEDRYESARALADDLERWLAGEPVSAWPEPLVRRAKRWARRHRTAVVASIAMVLTAFAGVSAIAIVQARANAGLRSMNERLDEQRRRAEDREDQAIEAVRKFRDAIINDPALRNGPELEELRKRLLKEPLTFFRSLRDRLQLDRDTRPESLDRLASACFEFGDLSMALGDRQDAMEAYRESRAVWKELVLVDPRNLRYLSMLASAIRNIGNLDRYHGLLDEAMALYKESLVS
jgi:serine/threonine protein kinase